MNKQLQAGCNYKGKSQGMLCSPLAFAEQRILRNCRNRQHGAGGNLAGNTEKLRALF